MRELDLREQGAVCGAGDANCERDDQGVVRCEGDFAGGTFDDMWVGGDNGSWHVWRDENGDVHTDFFPTGPLDSSGG
jgi:hypothetical protein